MGDSAWRGLHYIHEAGHGNHIERHVQKTALGLQLTLHATSITAQKATQKNHKLSHLRRTTHRTEGPGVGLDPPAPLPPSTKQLQQLVGRGEWAKGWGRVVNRLARGSAFCGFVNCGHHRRKKGAAVVGSESDFGRVTIL